MPILLADMPIESIPQSLGGSFTQYNEPYVFDLSVGGPLHYLGAPNTNDNTDCNDDDGGGYGDCDDGIIGSRSINVGDVGDTTCKGDINCNENDYNDHELYIDKKKNDETSITASLSVDMDMEDTITTITSERSNKISDSSDSTSSNSSSSSSGIENNHFNDTKMISLSSSIQQQLIVIDTMMFIIKLLLITTISIILTTVGTNHFKINRSELSQLLPLWLYITILTIIIIIDDDSSNDDDDD